MTPADELEDHWRRQLDCGLARSTVLEQCELKYRYLSTLLQRAMFRTFWMSLGAVSVIFVLSGAQAFVMNSGYPLLLNIASVPVLYLYLRKMYVLSQQEECLNTVWQSKY